MCVDVDQVMLFSLKDISVENVSLMYDLSEAFNAMSLRHTCILFVLEKFDNLIAFPGYVSHRFLAVPSIIYYSILKEIEQLYRKNSWSVMQLIAFIQSSSISYYHAPSTCLNHHRVLCNSQLKTNYYL